MEKQHLGGTCVSPRSKYLADLAGALNREFSGTENMGGNCQLCCKNDDEELVGARVGGQQRKHIGSRAAAFPDCSTGALHGLCAGFCTSLQVQALPGLEPAPCSLSCPIWVVGWLLLMS